MRVRFFLGGGGLFAFLERKGWRVFEERGEGGSRKQQVTSTDRYGEMDSFICPKGGFWI